MGTLGKVHTYEEFTALIDEWWKKYLVQTKNDETSRWRFGQFFFNFLHDLNPQIANSVRGTKLDPFHRDEVSDECHEFLRKEWSNK